MKDSRDVGIRNNMYSSCERKVGHVQQPKHGWQRLASSVAGVAGDVTKSNAHRETS
jgi:hypothetical protein